MKITNFSNHWDCLLLCERNPPRLEVKPDKGFDEPDDELEDDPLPDPLPPIRFDTPPKNELDVLDDDELEDPFPPNKLETPPNIELDVLEDEPEAPLFPKRPENFPNNELTELPEPDWLALPPVNPPNKLPRPFELLPPPKRPCALLSISIGPDCCYFPRSVLAIPLTDSGNIAVQSPLINWIVCIGSRLSNGLNLCCYLRFCVTLNATIVKSIVKVRSFISIPIKYIPKNYKKYFI